MRVTVDNSDTKRLAAAFDDAVREVPQETRKVVQRGAFNIKRDAQKRISGRSHLPHYPSAITYDTQDTPTGAHGEIGPDKDRLQGPLGNILEYGSPARPPIPHLAPALEAEAPKFQKALEDATLKAIGL